MAKAKKSRIRHSAIIRGLSRFSEKLSKKAENSLLARIFCGYFAVEKKASESFGAVVLQRRGVIYGFLSQLQNGICRFFSNNKLKNKFTGFLSDLLYLRTRDVGIYLFSSGLYAIIEYFIVKYAMNTKDLDEAVLYGSVGVVLLSLFFFSGKSLVHTLVKNPVLSFAVYDVMGADRNRLIPGEVRRRSPSFALLAGMVTGFLAFLVPPYRVLLFIICIIMLCAIFFTPETGAVLTVTVIPFFPLNQILILCFVSLLSYFLKVIRKKREFKFGPIDASVVLLAVLTLFGKLVSAKTADGTDSLYLLAVAAYFLCRNLLCKRQWLDRVLNAAALSSAAVSWFSLLFWFFGTPEQMIASRSLLSGVGGEMTAFFGSPVVFAGYILLTSPLLLYFGMQKKHGKLAYFLSFTASFSALVLTAKVYAIIAFIIINVFMLCVYSRHTVIFAALTVPALALAAVFMPGSWYSFIYEKIYTENAVIKNVWEGVFRLIGKSPLGGYGIGSFTAVYPDCANPGYTGADGAKSVYLQLTAEGGVMLALVFIACLVLFFMFCFTAIGRCGRREERQYVYAPLCAVLCAAVYGLTENVFCSEIVCILMFSVMGCGAAAAEICRREHDYEVAALTSGQV